MRVDRHAAEIEAIRRDVVQAPAVTERSDRARVMAGDSPRELSEFLEKARHASYRVTDEDIEALKRTGLSEDEIYELTVAAVVGVALERLDAAKRAMRSAL
jgi:hypothetical protein